MQITIVQAVVISIWIGLVMSRSFLGGATTTLRFTPMMTGLIVGLVFGRVAEAMIITAAIQLIYMGVFSPGGQMPLRACHCRSHCCTGGIAWRYEAGGSYRRCCTGWTARFLSVSVPLFRQHLRYAEIHG